MDGQRKMHWKADEKRIVEHTRSTESNQESFFYWSCPLGKTGYRGKCEWLDAHLGIGCHPSGENTNLLFVNSKKWCCKAASSMIKNSSDPTKKNTIVWLTCLNYATTCCCRHHVMCLKTKGLKILLDNIDCHCLLFVIYVFFRLAWLKKCTNFPTIAINLF